MNESGRPNWRSRRKPDSNASSHGPHHPQAEHTTIHQTRHHRHGNLGSAAHPPARRVGVVRWWSRLSVVPKVLATLAAIGGITSAGILIYNSYIVDKGPARFEGDLTSTKGTKALISILKREDGEVIYLDAHCLYGESKKPSCAWLTKTETYYGGKELSMVALTEDPDCAVKQEQETGKDSYDSLCPDTYWIHAIVNPATGARADNGSYGAGALAIKGYFSVTVTGSDGRSPPEITHVELRSVSPEDVEKGA